MTYQEFFKGKRVTLMGLGTLGRGVGDADFLARHVDELIVTDMKTADELAESVEKLKEHKNIVWKLGGHDFADFRGRDLIIKGAGVPFDSAYIHEAEKWQIPVSMSSALFAKLFNGIVIGVTGTKGKSTVSHLLHHIIAASGHRVHLGGNVRGVSTLALLEHMRAGDMAVLELDSWQLQGFAYENISPHISIFTNFMTDHMNYYRGDMERYFVDKSHIFDMHTAKEVLFTEQGVVATKWFPKKYPGKIFYREDVRSLPEVPALIGGYNKDNIAYAVAVARFLKISEEAIIDACKTFPGVPGRLQFVRTVAGVDYYNDTNGTLPIAVIQAIRSLIEKYSNVYLICGGADKEVALDDLRFEIWAHVSHAFLLEGSGTDRLLEQPLKTPYDMFSSLADAVKAAQQKAKEGSCVVLSPGFASFGMFKNEYDRGDQFNAIVEGL